MLLNTKINKLEMKRIQDSMDECEPVWTLTADPYCFCLASNYQETIEDVQILEGVQGGFPLVPYPLISCSSLCFLTLSVPDFSSPPPLISFSHISSFLSYSSHPMHSQEAVFSKAQQSPHQISLCYCSRLSSSSGTDWGGNIGQCYS